MQEVFIYIVNFNDNHSLISRILRNSMCCFKNAFQFQFILVLWSRISNLYLVDLMSEEIMFQIRLRFCYTNCVGSFIVNPAWLFTKGLFKY
jgi:hypothetical protein